MRGTSQASYTAVADGFEPVLQAAGADAAALGEQMLAVVDLLDGAASLRRALTDPARDGAGKAALVADLLGGKADDRVVEVVSALARARWSTEHDLTEALERLGADAVLAAAQSEGALQRVEEELFRLGRVLVGERALREALTDRLAPPSGRGALVRRLLDGKVHPVTVQLAERGATTPRGRTMATTLGELGRLAAHRRKLLVATVTAAAPPTGAQVERLVGLLERAYGRPVNVDVAVEPAVIGGMRVQVGSEVVDSTMLARLEDARRRMAG